MQKVTDSKIILRGFLQVNLPILVIIFGSLFLLIGFSEFSFNTSAIVSAIIGWIYWEFAVIKWIKWALLRDVDKDKLFRLGQRSLLLWNKTKIEKTAVSLNK